MSTEAAVPEAAVEPTLPENFLRPCLLLLLREQPAHGYNLLERLQPFGLEPSDTGRLYRALRSLEHEGLVHSAWEQSKSGPDRRTYQLTRPGMEELHRHARALAGTRGLMDAFLGRYEEFVALGRDRRDGDVPIEVELRQRS